MIHNGVSMVGIYTITAEAVRPVNCRIKYAIDE